MTEPAILYVGVSGTGMDSIIVTVIFQKSSLNFETTVSNMFPLSRTTNQKYMDKLDSESGL